VVENKAGAGGNIGADAVARGARDGSSVLIGIDSTFTVNPHVYKSMPPSDPRTSGRSRSWSRRACCSRSTGPPASARCRIWWRWAEAAD
jgi:hypothetical protein